MTTDPIHSHALAAALESERDREARVEELLLSGLDHYFAGQHELAINVWTRAKVRSSSTLARRLSSGEK